MYSKKNAYTSTVATIIALSMALVAGCGPEDPTYVIGGNVTGLTGQFELTEVNSGITEIVTINGAAYSFTDELGDNDSYNVRVTTHPSGQRCTVTNATGTVAAVDVANIDVDCADFILPSPGADEFGSWDVGYGHYPTEFAYDDDNDGGTPDRTVPLDIWYPVDPADTAGAVLASYDLFVGLGPKAEIAYGDSVPAGTPRPPVSSVANRNLIVFSHGSNAIALQSTLLMEALASHGFIVVSPEHVGNSQGTTTAGTFAEIGAYRLEDVNFIISEMIAKSADNADEFFDTINPNAVGVTGHSFGGHTAMAAAVGWDEDGPGGVPAVIPDPRVAAIAPISASLARDFADDSTDPSTIASIDIPVLLLGGTLDVGGSYGLQIAHNDYVRNNFPPAYPVYQSDVIGATHTSFANVCQIGDWLQGPPLNVAFEDWDTALGGALVTLIGPYTESCTGQNGVLDYLEVVRLESMYLVAFFHRHLQGLTEYDVYLTDELAATEPDNNFCTEDTDLPCTPP